MMSALFDQVVERRRNVKNVGHAVAAARLNWHPAITTIIEDMIIDLLSNKIREYRFRNGEMTQKELAGRVGVSRQTMNAIENCRHTPTIAVAIRLADVFGVSVDQLFELDYDGKPARREQAARVSLDQSRATIEKPIEIERENEPLDEKSERLVGLASLRNVLRHRHDLQLACQSMNEYKLADRAV